MIVSYNWLKEYFEESLPEAKALSDILNTRAFEVEGVEDTNENSLIDIDVLPNRAHDCLSHYGIAKEISVLTGLTIKEINPEIKQGDVSNIKVDIQDDVSNICKRYIALEINNVEVKESVSEIKNKLEVLGQKSINNIVDITNIVMLELGQPLHAFDADKLDGDIIIRFAGKGEKITTLDNKEIELTEEMLVIADQKNALAIAGVKGGKKAEVDSNTKNIVLESANFDQTSVRKTSQQTNVKTDSSKRFENGVTPELAEKGILRTAELIQKYAGGDVQKVVDVYPRPVGIYKTGVSLGEVNSLLGTDFSEKELEKVLDKLKFEYKKVKTKDVVLEESQKLIGKPYIYGASVLYDAPDNFDCSSFVAYVYSLGGVSIPRISVDQYVFSQEIEEKDLEPGDLIFADRHIVIESNQSKFVDNPDIQSKVSKLHDTSKEFLTGTKIERGIDHVGIYLGDGKIGNCSGDTGVIIEDLDKSERFKDIVSYRRIVEKDEERYVITIPDERLDLRNSADVIEEVGRVYGYENIEEKPINDMDFSPKINKEYFYNNLIRKTLVEDLGFSEIMTYSFVEEGEVQPVKPIADDKKYLRTTLITGMEKSLELNAHNADLLGLDHVKVFEIGNTYKKEGEILVLSLGVQNNKGIKKPKPSQILEEGITKLSEVLGKNLSEKIKINQDSNNLELNLSDLYKKLGDLDNKTEHVLFEEPDNTIYKPISKYPFMTRDISVWVQGSSKSNENEVLNIIQNNAGELLVNQKLKDVYTKEDEDRTSYSYGLVFESQEKTLTDEEVNKVMDSISKEMEGKGWEVR